MTKGIATPEDINNLKYWEGSVISQLKTIAELIPLPENEHKQKAILKARGQVKKNFREYCFYITKLWGERDQTKFPSRFAKKEPQKDVIDKENTSTNDISLPQKEVVTTTSETPRERIERIRKERGLQ